MAATAKRRESLRSATSVNWTFTSQPRTLQVRQHGHGHSWYVQCTVKRPKELSLVLDTRASRYDHQGDGHGGHKGRFKSEADALREALPFRAWCEFGRGKATQWRVKTPAERVALVNGWLQDDETASSSPSTVGQQQSSEITPDQPESAFQVRLAQRNAFKAAKQLLRDDDDVAGEHILNAEYYERQVEDLAQGRADIEVVCADPDGASVRQAKKIVMQTLAVSSYCSELGRRERVLANGGALEPSLKTTHSLADRVARGFNISGRTLREWFALWINNDCFALDRRGKSSAASRYLKINTYGTYTSAVVDCTIVMPPTIHNAARYAGIIRS